LRRLLAALLFCAILLLKTFRYLGSMNAANASVNALCFAGFTNVWALILPLFDFPLFGDVFLWVSLQNIALCTMLHFANILFVIRPLEISQNLLLCTCYNYQILLP